MTATDELRRMLTERGVEWETDGSGFRVMWGQPVSIDQMQFKAVDNALPNGGLNISICGFSPEQAIAATLGHSLNNPSMSETLSERGTCRLPETRIDHGSIEYNGTTSWRLCSACGAEVLADPANYCPNCGRRCVD